MKQKIYFIKPYIMTLDLIQNKEYLKAQILKTPAKILLNNFTGYYFLTEDRAKNYFEHVIGMISLQSPDKNTGDICMDLINKYSSKLKTYKSKGEKKENMSVTMFLLFIMVALIFISLFVIATWYKSFALIYILLLISTCVIFYITSVYNSSYDKKAQNLENALSSLNELVASYNLVHVPSDEDVAKNNILSILKFMSDEGYIKLEFEITSYKFNEVSDLGSIPMTNIVRILHILTKHEKIEFAEKLQVNEFAKKTANHFRNNGRQINAKSFETTFNDLINDETRHDLDRIKGIYKDVLSVLFNINQ